MWQSRHDVLYAAGGSLAAVAMGLKSIVTYHLARTTMRFYLDPGMRALFLVSLLAMFLFGRRFPRAVVGWLLGVIAGGLASGIAWIAAGVGLVGAGIGFVLDRRRFQGRPTRRR
jgi:hypothetical protein